MKVLVCFAQKMGRVYVVLVQTTLGRLSAATGHVHQAKSYFKDVALCGKVYKPIKNAAGLASAVFNEALLLLLAAAAETGHYSESGKAARSANMQCIERRQIESKAGPPRPNKKSQETL